MYESDPELTLALHNSLNRLKLAEDYCDMFDRLVDMSDIASFGAGPGEMTGIPGVTDPATAYSRALIYPGATAFAYINEIELRQIRARSRVFAQTNPYQFPSAEAPVDKNVAAIQAELRAAAAALAMPEYTLSGDASNANFSSTMVAEGPAVKTFEELQADLIAADVEIMERQLTIAARAGLIYMDGGRRGQNQPCRGRHYRPIIPTRRRAGCHTPPG